MCLKAKQKGKTSQVMTFEVEFVWQESSCNPELHDYQVTTYLVTLQIFLSWHSVSPKNSQEYIASWVLYYQLHLALSELTKGAYIPCGPFSRASYWELLCLSHLLWRFGFLGHICGPCDDIVFSWTILVTLLWSSFISAGNLIAICELNLEFQNKTFYSREV